MSSRRSFFNNPDIASEVAKHASWKDSLNFIKATNVDRDAINYDPIKRKIGKSLLHQHRGHQLFKDAMQLQTRPWVDDDDEYPDSYVIKALRMGHANIAKKIADRLNYSPGVIYKYLDHMANDGFQHTDYLNLFWLFSHSADNLEILIYVTTSTLYGHVTFRRKITQDNEAVYAKGLKYVFKIARHFNAIDDSSDIRSMKLLLQAAQEHNLHLIAKVLENALAH